MVTRRRYTKGQKAEAVAAATLSSVEAAAERMGIPRTTIIYWLDQPEFVELRQKTRDQVADRMWAAIQVGVEEVAKGLTSDAPLRDKSVALGVLYDKHALLTGGATGRTESRDITGTLSDGDLTAALREAERIAAGSGDTEASEGASAGEL
jgi:hypothetical protein